MKNIYDIAFLGNYTRDTIVSASGTCVVDGGAVLYGANVAARMGLKTAVVTRLAEEDLPVLAELKELGVEVLAHCVASSTCLRLEYPTDNVDKRLMWVTSTAGEFGVEEVGGLRAKRVVIGGSIRGEVGIEVLGALVSHKMPLSLDVQGFMRVIRDGKLFYEEWPEKKEVLSLVDILKADAVEAEQLTGCSDIGEAAQMLSELGPAEILITHRDGVLIFDGEDFHCTEFFPEKLIGRSGRGDTCLAAYTAARLTSPPAKALIWAAAVTSLKMEAEGPFRRDLRDVKELIAASY
jgi:sugar/nucleoside kinase (ribokinase family)